MSLLDSILGSLRVLIRAEVNDPVITDGSPPVGPQFCVWRYTVSPGPTDSEVSARALSPRCPWPDLPAVPIYPGIAGGRYKPAVGSEVGIAFADGDPRYPRIVWADQTVPYTATIDAAENPNAQPGEVSGLVSVGPSADFVRIADATGTEPAIHRVGDTGSAGSLEGAGNTIIVKNPVGDTIGTLSFASSSAITVTGVSPLETLALVGSTKGTCG